MSRFRELVAECERDELEQTQDIAEIWGGRPEGVYRMSGTRCPDGTLHTMQRAPDLSLRYPSVHIDMTRRQAC